YIRLLKLLYLADRNSLLRYNKPITGDRYVAMKYGPVLSTVFELLKADVPAEGVESAGPWQTTMATAGYYVRLVGEPDVTPLSEAEIELLKEAWQVCQKLDDWKLSRWTHEFPEWKDPGDSAFDIHPEDILQALGKDEEEIDEARQHAVEKAY